MQEMIIPNPIAECADLLLLTVSSLSFMFSELQPVCIEISHSQEPCCSPWKDEKCFLFLKEDL